MLALFRCSREDGECACFLSLRGIVSIYSSQVKYALYKIRVLITIAAVPELAHISRAYRCNSFYPVICNCSA